MKRFLLFSGVAALGVIVVLGVRRVPRLASYYGPVGECVTANIDLDRPDPYVKLQLEGTAVGFAASGGGSRAAYLTAAVLREIRRSGLTALDGHPSADTKSLLDQIDLVSSVSGGSLAAAYFVAHSDELKRVGADDAPWREFSDKMAYSYRPNEYWKAALSPAIWTKALFTNYNRGVLARDDYDERDFGGATLASLPNRPALFVNAFDVGNHVRFILSKHYIDVADFQPRDYWGKLAAPQEITSANDLTFTKINPASVRLADAVYASSAFPVAYPNMAIRHCGTKILFQGQQIFLADGGLADNSGLITLLTQMRVALRDAAHPARVLAVSIDASLDRVETNGSRFQQRGIEDSYAWRNTILGHGDETIRAAVDMLQDIGFKFIESTGVVTDEINLNWPAELTSRTGRCAAESRANWNGLFESGKLEMRPLVLRLGLRDLLNPEFLMRVNEWRASLPADSSEGMPVTLAQWGRTLSSELIQINTDFALTKESRVVLDQAAYLLVHIKLSSDLEAWNDAARAASANRKLHLTCPV